MKTTIYALTLDAKLKTLLRSLMHYVSVEWVWCADDKELLTRLRASRETNDQLWLLADYRAIASARLKAVLDGLRLAMHNDNVHWIAPVKDFSRLPNQQHKYGVQDFVHRSHRLFMQLVKMRHQLHDADLTIQSWRSEHHQIHRTLASQQAFWKTLSDISDIGYVITDERYLIQETSPGAMKYIGHHAMGSSILERLRLKPQLIEQIAQTDPLKFSTKLLSDARVKLSITLTVQNHERWIWIIENVTRQEEIKLVAKHSSFDAYKYLRLKQSLTLQDKHLSDLSNLLDIGDQLVQQCGETEQGTNLLLSWMDTRELLQNKLASVQCHSLQQQRLLQFDEDDVVFTFDDFKQNVSLIVNTARKGEDVSIEFVEPKSSLFDLYLANFSLISHFIASLILQLDISDHRIAIDMQHQDNQLQFQLKFSGELDTELLQNLTHSIEEKYVVFRMAFENLGLSMYTNQSGHNTLIHLNFPMKINP